ARTGGWLQANLAAARHRERERKMGAQLVQLSHQIRPARARFRCNLQIVANRGAQPDRLAMRVCADMCACIEQPALAHPLLQLPRRSQLILTSVLADLLRVTAQVQRIDEVVEQSELRRNLEYSRGFHATPVYLFWWLTQ